jgi:hypothetical protein
MSSWPVKIKVQKFCLINLKLYYRNQNTSFQEQTKPKRILSGNFALQQGIGW